MEENQVTPKWSGFAIASFVLAFTFFGALLSLLFGAIALAQTAGRPNLRGQGLAIAGIAISIVLWAIAILLPVLTHPYINTRRVHCLNNLKQIGTAINMYASDWDDKYPLVSGPGREFERVWPDINKPFPANLRTKSSDGERRWFQDLLAPYARNRRIFMCQSVTENGTWKTPKGTICYYKNRHGGWKTAEGDYHGTDSEQPVRPPKGSPRPATLEQDPPTTYFFNAVAARGRQSLLISGESEKICARTADAPLVWDTPCGYDDGSGRISLAHEDSINVVYADGHARNFSFGRYESNELKTSQFWVMHGSEGWFADGNTTIGGKQ
jgi:prepilin-type processing-associated H-X9-DG protein